MKDLLLFLKLLPGSVKIRFWVGFSVSATISLVVLNNKSLILFISVIIAILIEQISKFIFTKKFNIFNIFSMFTGTTLYLLLSEILK